MNDDIKKVMGFYALLNKQTNQYECFMTSFDDKEAVDFYLAQLADIAINLSDAGEVEKYNTFISRLTDSCVLRLATFNDELGSFVNEKVILLDYFTEDSIIQYVNNKKALKSKFKVGVDDVR